MKTLVNVARYHLADPLIYVALPWAILTLGFGVNVVIATMTPARTDYTGGLLSIYIFVLLCGAVSMTRSLPYGLMLGVSRRGYYLGTALLMVLFFLYGMWYGLVYRRWSLPGLTAFIAAQVLVALGVVVAVSMTHHWPAVGQFLTTLTAPALTGVLAAIAVALGLGGFSTIRRVTV